MNTKQLYYEEPYLAECSAEIITLEDKGANTVVELDQTIFYPEGGGQPSDQGDIVGIQGRLKLILVQFKDGRILHLGKKSGELAVGEKVTLQLKWGSRQHNMRVHAAGHLVHDVLMTMTDHLKPTKGSHGNKAYIQYAGVIDPTLKGEIEKRVNEAIDIDMPIVMKESTIDEIEQVCRFVPPGLPRNKALRILKIGEFNPMPDGGVHVKSTKEIGKIIIQDIKIMDGNTIINYRITGGESPDQSGSA